MASRWPALEASWRQSVEAELVELCRRYEADPIAVLPARYGFVVEVATVNGPLVMRASPDPNGSFQSAVAMRLAEIGAGPRVHEVTQTESGTWTVMDRIEPGTPLYALPVNEDLSLPLAAMLRPLVDQLAPAPDMPSISQWLRHRLEQGDGLQDLAPGRSPAHHDQRQEALAVLDDLSADDLSGLCHGDASTGNLLLAANDRMLMIDPRGMRGEAAYDVAVVALKATRWLPAVDTVAILADMVGVDRERVQAWVTVADAARV
ncbi:phosphotransferase [Planobispora siamensis]|uniref:phosphotransferase n=1 Tax=Planobispora siamensis TaxID=936338 RepID=UPI0035E67CB1